MSEHVYDGADGGICVKCNQCKHPDCCKQTDDCPNWYGNRLWDTIKDNRLENLQLRNGKHGSGHSLVCGECGSANLVPEPIGIAIQSGVVIRQTIALDFSDVLIVPEHSSISSRKDVDLTREFFFLHSSRTWSGIPVISANMSSVTTKEVVYKMVEHGMLACVPKTLNFEEFIGLTGAIQSLGLNDKPHPEANWICLDLPTAYLDVAVQRTRDLREMNPDSIIIVGNVVTAGGVRTLLNSGADIVKVGIGSGSACSTRIKTGVGMPQLSAVIECSEEAEKWGGMIISDGGCQVPGDICKALVAGSHMVMIGGMLGGHNENGEDLYGMSSERANNEFAGGLKDYKTSEGWEMKLPNRGPIDRTLQDITGGIRSACSYVGARSIVDLQKATFVQVNRTVNTSLWEHRT